jgi:hypothetical protein
MRGYRCYLIGPADRIVDHHEFHAEDDRGALEEARRIFAHAPAYLQKAEVWQLGRLVEVLHRDG